MRRTGHIVKRLGIIHIQSGKIRRIGKSRVQFGEKLKVLAKTRVSFTEFSFWRQCPYKRCLMYDGILIDGVVQKAPKPFGEGITLGNLVHDFIKCKLKKYPKEKIIAIIEKTKQEFPKEYIKLKPKINHFFDYLKAEGLIVVDVESYIEMPYKEGSDIKFSFKMDSVLKFPEHNKFLLLDYKTAGYRYIYDLKTKAQYQRQLQLYRYYYSKYANINIDDITPKFVFFDKTNKKCECELYEVKATDRITANAIKDIDNCVLTRTGSVQMKNFSECYRCHLANTKWCHN